VVLISPLFLSKQASDGFELLRKDLGKLRQKNTEAIPERQLKLLDRVQELSYVVITIVVAVVIIIAVWTILTSSGMDALTKMVSWVMDILKLARLGV